jgi:hypothetical protein
MHCLSFIFDCSIERYSSSPETSHESVITEVVGFFITGVCIFLLLTLALTTDLLIFLAESLKIALEISFSNSTF